jgi:RimJ/RimL family protein N-acetyltransferase
MVGSLPECIRVAERMRPIPLHSARLSYERLALGAVDTFHSLVVDAHVRLYLLDGEVMDRAWCEAEVERSDALFASVGFGLWLVYEAGAGERDAIGFCGYRRFEELSDEPQLLYAFLEPYTGRGYATEVARALVDFAKANTSLRKIDSAVDEPNTASARVLEKTGFQRCGDVPGAFGRIFLFELALDE